MMKHLTALLIVFCSGLAYGKTDIPITGVVVFAGRAQVTRSAALDLKAGATVLDLEGLPWDLEESSVRVGLDGAGVALRRVEIEPVFSRLVREEEAAQLKEQVAALKAAVHDLAKRSDLLRQQIAFLGSFQVATRPHAANQAPPPVAINPKSWMGVLDFVSEGLRISFKQLDELNKESDERSKDLELLSTRLERLSSKDAKRYKNVHVYLAADKDAATAVSVSYMVPGPQWYPRYEARADVPSGKVTLNAYALVRQETGEDWKNAVITVSTVDLSISANLPALVTDRISPAGIMHIKPSVLLAAGQAAPGEKPRPAAGPPPPAPPAKPSKELLRADEAKRERDSLSALQNELTQQRANLVTVRKFGGAGKDAAQPSPPEAERPAAAKGQVQQGQQSAQNQAQVQDGGRYEKLRGLYRGQNAALQAKNYGDFSAMNSDIVQLVNTLAPKEQTALVEFTREASDNVAKAQRLMRSEKLEKDLVSPLASAAGVDYRFQSIGPANVYSEWVLTKVPYLEVEVPVKFAYESAPILSQLFYLIGAGSNPLDRPLLAGPMAVFVGPDFVGESALANQPSGSGMRFELGIDREVEVRRQIERRRDTSGWLLRYYHHTYDVTIYTINRKPAPVEAIVVDRIPYDPAKEPTVEVKELAMDPEPSGRWDGARKWNMTLAPGETRAIKFSYEMSHRRSLALVASERGASW